MIDINQAIDQAAPLASKYPLLKKTTAYLLTKALYLEKINALIERNSQYMGFDFLERLIEELGIRYTVPSDQIENIPAEGRVIIVANHPLGSLDGLALVQMITKVRRDVSIVVNQLLYQVEQIQAFTLPVNNMRGSTGDDKLSDIQQALLNEEAVIFFPSGEVSRAGPKGVRDTYWRTGFLRFALSTNTSVLPIHIEAKNSKLFYSISAVARKISSILLAREMFNNKKPIHFTIGELVPSDEIEAIHLPLRDTAKLFRKHVYRIGKDKSPLLKTVRAIAHPERRVYIRKQLEACNQLASMSASKFVYITDYDADSSLMREIGRLREIAFRHVGEGSGNKRDLDDYDFTYQHIILWDDSELEIIGAYRVGNASHLLNNGKDTSEPLYTQSLFTLSDATLERFSHGIELGRNFIQPKYWGRNSLEYLWKGLGAYIAENPQIKTLFGPVTISNHYPKLAKDLLIYYLQQYYSPAESQATAKVPYLLSPQAVEECQSILSGNDIEQDMDNLKSYLSHMGVSIPILFKKYIDLCEPGGVKFLGFNVDANFGYCIDGLIEVDISKVKQKKYERFVGKHLQSNE